VSPLSFDSGESIGISMPGEASTQIAIQLLQTFIQWVLCHLISASPRWNMSRGQLHWLLLVSSCWNI
jgi:hypothetical protein